MSNCNIQHLNTFKQDTMEGVLKVSHHPLQSHAFTVLVHRVIREYGKYDGHSYSVNLNDLDLCDIRLLLSHIAEHDDYEHACSSSISLENIFREYSPFMQKCIDAECDEVYRDDMWEMGMTPRQHADNGETYWVRR